MIAEWLVAILVFGAILGFVGWFVFSNYKENTKRIYYKQMSDKIFGRG